MDGNPERTEFRLSVPAGEEERFREWFLTVSRSAVAIDNEGLHFAELACSRWPLVLGQQITISYSDYFEAWLEQRCARERRQINLMCRELLERISWLLAPQHVIRWLQPPADQPGTGE